MAGGDVQKNFLLPEMKCEFQISEKRKKIWKVQIELIEEFERVCQKYHLRYYASNGTLLGIVRHKGFIPWDDDVDIIMPRPDYEKLIAVAETEFKAPFFLHTAMNCSGYYRNYIRLRNSNTTAISLKDLNRQSNNGIFIDIFPMDGCSNNALIRRGQFFIVTAYSAIANTYTYYPDFEEYRLFRKVVYLFSCFYCGVLGYNGLIEKMEQLRSKIAYDNAQKVYVITHGRKCMVFPKAYFESVKLMEFEYIKLPVPTAYDAILKSHYGNYKELPPVEDRGQHHKIFFDPDKPYTEYIGVMTKKEAEKYLNNY